MSYGGATRVILRCEQCRHEWPARNTISKSRHCSKCNFKQIVEVSGDKAAPPPEIAPKNAEAVMEKIPVPPLLKDDPDIHHKLKELNLARLDRQIAEERANINQEGALEIIALTQKMILDTLHDNGLIDDDDFVFMTSVCPWCGNSAMHHVEVKPYI